MVVLNLLGEEIRVLENDRKPAGSYSIQWDGKNNMGNEQSSGLYFIQIQTKQDTKSIKALLIK